MSDSTHKKRADKKVVIIGDMGVGKTALIRRYIECVFDVGGTSTIGAAFFIKQWNGKNIALWDTGGQERFEGIRTFYSRNAHAVILCYNICQLSSFESLISTHSRLFENVAPNCVLVFVGTKSDLIGINCEGVQHERELTADEVTNVYLKYREKLCCLEHPSGIIPVFETSSKLNENVTEVFEYIFDTLVPLNVIEGNAPEVVEVSASVRGTEEIKCCNT